MLVDSHCHLNYEGIVEHQDAVLDRARDAGVGRFLNISTRESEWEDIVSTAERNDDVFASIGIHPHNADEHQHIDEDRLRAAVDHPKVVGIGETGLDYYYEHSDREAQQRLFRRHITVARETKLPVIIHTRDAEDDTLAILRDEMEQGAFPALIHCFTASGAFGDTVLELGLSISISGIVTFKNAKDLQEMAARVPTDRLLIETDAPFLAPVPHRGKTCEPAYVADTARFVAELRGIDIEELSSTTTRNFFELFAKTVV